MVINRRQSGVALIFALLVLLVVTLLGLAAIRNTTIFQRIMSNFYDRELAFQAAEAGLAAAAQLIGTTSNIRNCGQGGSACQSNPFADPNASSFIQAVPAGTASGQFTAGLNANYQPQFVIENMGTWVDPSTSTGFGQTANAAAYGAQGASTTAVYYRVTARSADPANVGDRAVVTLQAMYKQ